MRYVSSSELEDWRRCRRKWWLRHVRNLAPAREVKGVAYQGNLVHDALDLYYKGAEWQYPLILLDERKDAAVASGDRAEVAAIDSALAMLEGYFEWLEQEGADEDWEVTSSEEALSMPLTADTTLVGKLDLAMRQRSTGFRGLVDHKSSGDLLGLEAFGWFRPQFRHYLMLAQAVYGGRIDGLVVNALKRSKRTARAKGPFFHRFTVRHNPETLRTYELQVRGEVSRMEQTLQLLGRYHGATDAHHSLVPPSPQADCPRMCPFAAVCGLFDDGSDAEGALTDDFRVVDPMARYGGEFTQSEE